MALKKSLLSLKKVSLDLSGRQVLSNISFDLYPKQMMTLVGPNGAGKSTLLKVILGLLKPTSGTLIFSKKTSMGYMPQRLSLDQTLPLTVARFLSLSEPCLDIDIALKKVGGQNLKDGSIHVLSGGEFQRVLLAKAILKSPEFLVLDEPNQGVDAPGQNIFYGLLNELRQELKCTVLLVSHDLYFVHAASDQVICLNQHICCAGHPREIENNPEYRVLFKNMSPYPHTHDHSHDSPLEKENQA